MTNLKQLSYHGKKKFLNAIEKYIDAKIEWAITNNGGFQSDILYEEQKKECEEAEKELMEMFKKIEMRLV